MNQASKERIGRLRLIKLADYISKLQAVENDDLKIITFYQREGKHLIEIETHFPSWVIEVLTNVFQDWLYSLAHDDFDIIPAFFNFFSLSDDEFIHCFDLKGNQKTEIFEGKILNENSSFKDIAENILAVVKYRKKTIDINKSGC